MTTKTCKICGRPLPLSEFYRHKLYKDGYRTECKDCFDEKMKKYRKEKRTKKSQSPTALPVLRLSDITDEDLFAELRTRGYTGELRYSKVLTV